MKTKTTTKKKPVQRCRICLTKGNFKGHIDMSDARSDGSDYLYYPVCPRCVTIIDLFIDGILVDKKGSE
jgi:hypothetical protein